MNVNELHDALGLLDDDVIADVDRLRLSETKRSRAPHLLLTRYVSVAACLCLIVAGVITASVISGENKSSPVYTEDKTLYDSMIKGDCVTEKDENEVVHTSDGPPLPEGIDTFADTYTPPDSVCPPASTTYDVSDSTDAETRVASSSTDAPVDSKPTLDEPLAPSDGQTDIEHNSFKAVISITKVTDEAIIGEVISAHGFSAGDVVKVVLEAGTDGAVKDDILSSAETVSVVYKSFDSGNGVIFAKSVEILK